MLELKRNFNRVVTDHIPDPFCCERGDEQCYLFTVDAMDEGV